MKKRILSLMIILALVVASIIGCTNNPAEGSHKEPAPEGSQQQPEELESAYPMTIIDGLGNEVTIEKRPERIISIAPSQTEILYALGLGDLLVAVSDYCDYPEEALAKEKVGSAWTTNVEKILELTPDIVFVYGEGQAEAMEQLKAAGITVVKYMPESVDQILNAILAVGEIMDEEEKANALVESMKEKRDEIVAKVKNQPKKKVFYQVWDEPLMTAGPGSFIDELITLAGGENIAANTDGHWPEYSVEALVEADPVVYLAPAHTMESNQLTKEEEDAMKEAIASKPGFEGVSAVVNNRIELLEPNILSRPGARIMEALEIVAKAIHPEVF
ncbi:ABC transporter substrate-binding protein [Alkaliphilus serpentinus]|uniref:ABC transporter substrate-binding protein n=1 Tax=Alkaliphilus serpentinus TaxID=1482731 RepID=A0A833M7R7_9FIRM|nr:ABC transporter substrate-binding protein [Alkaliphilus serpentinus]KAB3529153.1 ABC transporter substrate-binding protein [Alkaliphilus serpentinus]